jgi:hypothetical protein
MFRRRRVHRSTYIEGPLHVNICKARPHSRSETGRHASVKPISEFDWLSDNQERISKAKAFHQNIGICLIAVQSSKRCEQEQQENKGQEERVQWESCCSNHAELIWTLPIFQGVPRIISNRQDQPSTVALFCTATLPPSLNPTRKLTTSQEPITQRRHHPSKHPETCSK